ncbi:MAG: hypothetical protein ACRD0P_05760 [Stackebrandtia sp.]
MRLPRKRVLIAGATIVGVAAVGTPVAIALADNASPGSSAGTGTAKCEAVALEVPDGAPTEGYEDVVVSPDGEYIAASARMIVDGEAEEGAVMWHDGKATVIDDAFTVVDVNSSGTVVGFTGSEGEPRPMTWTDGEFTELTVSEPNGRVMVEGINDAGDIAGSTGGAEDSPPTGAVKWAEGATEATGLSIPDDVAEVEVTGIAEDGTVTGALLTGENDPYLWHPDGKGEHMKPVPATESDYNLPRYVAGDWAMSDVADDGVHYRWDLNDPSKAEKMKVGLDPSAVDAEGGVYGGVEGDGFYGSPALQDAEGAVTELPKKLDGKLLTALNDASADGSVLTGLVEVGDSEIPTKPVRWTCA